MSPSVRYHIQKCSINLCYKPKCTDIHVYNLCEKYYNKDIPFNDFNSFLYLF